MTDLVELMLYAAALDIYARLNRKELSWRQFDNRQVSALLDCVAWETRPALAR